MSAPLRPSESLRQALAALPALSHALLGAPETPALPGRAEPGRTLPAQGAPRRTRQLTGVKPVPFGSDGREPDRPRKKYIPTTQTHLLRPGIPRHLWGVVQEQLRRSPSSAHLSTIPRPAGEGQPPTRPELLGPGAG